MSYFGKFLLIDNDEKTLEIVYKDQALLDNYPCSTTRSIAEATRLLENSGKEFRMIFLSERLARKTDLSDFISKLEKYPSLKIILIEDKIPSGDLRAIAYSRIAVPRNYMELVKVMEAETAKLNDWRTIKNDGNAKDQEILAHDENYLPISMRDFLVTPKSYFNFYLRLAAGRFIKVYNAGDSLSKEDIDRYQSKGIEEIWLPKNEHEKYTRLQGIFSSKVVASDFPEALKFNTVMKLGANVTNNLMKCGITPERMDTAYLFLDQAVHILRNLKTKESIISNYLKDLSTNEHTSAITFISGILAHDLGFESAKSIKVVGTTALLHDIGLYDLDPNFVEGEELVDEKKQEIFNKHAAHGAEILRRAGSFDEQVCHAVENHHRRKQGENAKRRSTSVNLVSEIISVSEEFFHTVINQGYSPDKAQLFLDRELKNYSPAVEKAFQFLMKGKKAA